ncbi:Serine hydroxymethyltransferase [Gimesia panareensis]|uniref:Serine hydroxymethyltransferase n=1 Tax=Gimesia panareensis TaxID=2527978 RepID=A0A518FKK4_9PLAN|nr:serine hydroxymethyltransferase [Gimesia panareensis]QDV16872.1 Serine hydroxymethyltransferase [Gimesia panareensis]
MSVLESCDPEIWNLIQAEAKRQKDGLELIASENYTSAAIMEAAGSILTNKYAEGLPGRRYYGGCENVDVIENLARDRACSLFGAEYANVQPHSGSQANMSVYFTVLKPGDTFLAMDLAHGGHLTHGMKLNFSGSLYNPVPYGVREDNHQIDYDQVAKLAREHKPKMIIAGASAYPREIDHPKFAEIAAEVGAVLMVDMAHYAGLVAGGVHNNPVEVADFVTSTTHKTLRGPRSGFVLMKKKYAKDLNREVFPGIQGGPLEHVIAGKAVCFKEAATDDFKAYAQQIVANAKALAETLLAGGIKLASGGTDNHLMLCDVTAIGLSGKIAEEALDKAGITVNKNMIPYDQRKPLDPSGIRIGTAALTTRGMKEDEMKKVGAWILKVLGAPEDEATIAAVKGEIEDFAQSFPVPGIA